MQGFYVFISLISFKDIFYFSLLKYALYQTYVAIFFYWLMFNPHSIIQLKNKKARFTPHLQHII